MPVKHVIVAGSSVSWERLSDAGNWVVFGFGMVLFATCVVAVLHLGIQEMFSPRHKRTKHKPRKHQQWSTQRQGRT